MDPSAIVQITGPILLSHLLNYTLTGVLCVQMYMYCLTFKDPLFIRSLVWGAFILDIIETCFAGHYAWYMLAAGWGNPSALTETPWTLSATLPISGLVAFLVQIFYIWRIVALSGRKIRYICLSSILFLGALTSFGASVWTGVKFGTVHNLLRVSEVKSAATTWFAGSAALDVLLSATLVFLLASTSQQIGFKSTRAKIHRTIRMTVETGVTVAALVTIELVLYLNANQAVASWYFLFGLSIGKFYSNSLLANLNSRAAGNSANNGSSVITNSIAWSTPSAPARSVTSNGTFIGDVTVSTEITRDLELGDYPTKEGLHGGYMIGKTSNDYAS